MPSTQQVKQAAKELYSKWYTLLYCLSLLRLTSTVCSSTLKELRIAVENQLKISPEEGRQWRSVIKQTAAGIATKQAQQEVSESDDCSELSATRSPARGVKRPRSPDVAAASKSSTSQNKKAARESSTARQRRALTAFIKASRIGPHIFKSVADVERGTQAYIRQLSAALKQAQPGAFKGLVPTKAEIQAASEKQERLMDLEGLDTANVLDSGRKRRPRASRTLQAAERGRVADSSDEVESEESDSHSSSNSTNSPAAAAKGGTGFDSDIFDAESDSE